MIRSALLLSLSVASVFWGSLGQADSAITEMDILSDIDVSTASRFTHKRTHSPASVTIIDRKLIDASGAQSWADLFRLVPGMQAYSINGNRAGVDYHGLGDEFPRRLEVTVDGRSVYQPLFSAVDWGVLNVAIDDIDYIEVVRGSNAATQGSNAFSGAINIVTQKPYLNDSSRVSFAAGSRNTQRVNISKNGYNGSLDYQVNLGFERNDGFPAVTESDDHDDIGALEDGRDLFTADFRAIYAPNLHDTFDFNAGYSHNHSGWGDADHPDEYSVAEWDTRFVSLKWDRLLDNGHEIKSQVYASNFKVSNEDEALISELLSVPPDFVPFALQFIGAPALEDQPIDIGFGDVEANRYDFEVEYLGALTDHIRFSLGTGYRYEDLKSQQVFDSSATLDRKSLRLFGGIEWMINEQWALNYVGIIEDNDYLGALRSRRLSLNFNPTEHHGFRASYADGERSPSLLEANEKNLSRLDDAVWEVIRFSDPGIAQEKIRSYELAYLTTIHPSISLELKLFYEDLEDLVYDQRHPIEDLVPLLPEGSFFTSNLEIAKINESTLDMEKQGAEVEVLYRPASDWLLAFHYTYMDLDGTIPRIRNDERLDEFGHRVATHTASLLAQVPISESVNSSIWVYHMSELDWLDGNFIDEYIRVDAQLRYGFQWGNNSGSIALVGQNLGGDYSEFSRNNVFETRFYLTVQMELP
ncbi:MAG: TonB-dependent receptor plug domain-containing protein [bacterium]